MNGESSAQSSNIAMSYTNTLLAMLHHDLKINKDMLEQRRREITDSGGKLAALQAKIDKLKDEEKLIAPNWHRARREAQEEKHKREVLFALCKQAIIIGAALDDLRTEIPDLLAAVEAWASAMPPDSSKGAEGVASALRESVKARMRERQKLETRFHAFHDHLSQHYDSEVSTDAIKAAGDVSTDVAAELRVWSDELTNAEHTIACWEQEAQHRSGRSKGKGKARAAFFRRSYTS